MKKEVIFLILFAALILAGCSQNQVEEEPDDGINRTVNCFRDYSNDKGYTLNIDSPDSKIRYALIGFGERRPFATLDEAFIFLRENKIESISIDYSSCDITDETEELIDRLRQENIRVVNINFVQGFGDPENVPVDTSNWMRKRN